MLNSDRVEFLPQNPPTVNADGSNSKLEQMVTVPDPTSQLKDPNSELSRISQENVGLINDDLKDLAVGLVGHVLDLKSENNVLENLSRGLVRDALDLRSKNAILEERTRGLTGDNANLRSRNAALEDQTRSLKSEVDTLNEVTLSLNRDNGLLARQLGILRLKFNDLKSHHNITIQENVALRSEKDSLEDQVRALKKLNDDVDKLKQEIERINAEKAKSTLRHPKNSEWMSGEQQFKMRWVAARRSLPPIQPGDDGNELNYLIDRFKAGMSVIHEASLDPTVEFPHPMVTRVRAGIEYLIPQVWPSYAILIEFFSNPKSNVGFLTPEQLARIIYTPEPIRNLTSFNDSQKEKIIKIRRTLRVALQSDLSKSGADPKLADSADHLLLQLNILWPSRKI